MDCKISVNPGPTGIMFFEAWCHYSYATLRKKTRMMDTSQQGYDFTFDSAHCDECFTIQSNHPPFKVHNIASSDAVPDSRSYLKVRKSLSASLGTDVESHSSLCKS